MLLLTLGNNLRVYASVAGVREKKGGHQGVKSKRSVDKELRDPVYFITDHSDHLCSALTSLFVNNTRNYKLETGTGC